jgi:hypothetical protein
MLRDSAFPAAEISFRTTRAAFAHEPGAVFKFSYTPWGVSNLVCRVIRIEEGSLEDDAITVTALEEAVNKTRIEGAYKLTIGDGVSHPSYDLTAIEYTKVLEAPYAAVGDDIRIIPLAARAQDTDSGYLVYMSLDGGDSYSKIGQVTGYFPYGTLVAAYPDDTMPIDDTVGFEVDFVNDDGETIESVTRDYLYSGKNLALIGDEVISFQTITPDGSADRRYKIEGVYRGRLDTDPAAHAAGAAFWYVGAAWTPFDDAQFTYGSTRHFKLVPYNAKYSGDAADATAISYTITGRAKTPYPVENLKANGDAADATPEYSTDIELAWAPRVRSRGSGIGDPAWTVDDPITTEGEFRVKAYIGGTLVNTDDLAEADLTVGATAVTHTYAQATIEGWNGGALPASITFRVSNFAEEAGQEFESETREITSILV